VSLSVWLIFGLLLFANALYVAAEFGAVGVRRSRIRRLSEDGNPFARRLQPFVEDAVELDRYVAASQIGITLSGLILGAYAQATATVALAPWISNTFGGMFHLDAETALSAATVTVLIVLTAVQVVFVELIPKSTALQFPTQVALGTVMPMLASVWLFTPVIYVLNGAASAILRLFGGGPTTHRHLHSPATRAATQPAHRGRPDDSARPPHDAQRRHTLERRHPRRLRQPIQPAARVSRHAGPDLRHRAGQRSGAPVPQALVRRARFTRFTGFTRFTRFP
jgi:CBS domain containing-hemolysin-like protein